MAELEMTLPGKKFAFTPSTFCAGCFIPFCMLSIHCHSLGFSFSGRSFWGLGELLLFIPSLP